MAATPIDPAVLQANLDAARIAYHSLIIGGSVRVVVDQNGERVEFTSSNAGKLMAYITWLERQLDGCPKGPAGAYF